MNAPFRRTADLDISRCEQCPIRPRAFCRAATGTGFEELAKISRIRRFEAGDTIIGQKDTSRLVGNVREGVLKLVKSLPDGRTHIVGLLHAADFFGRLYSANSEFSLEAATEVELCTIERSMLEAYLLRNPGVEHELYVANLGQLDKARERTMLLACHSTLERLAAYLALRMLEVEAGGQTGRVVVPSSLSRRDFAAYLGTTVETVSRNIQLMARERVIRILDSGHFEVLRRGTLFELSGQDEDDLAAELGSYSTTGRSSDLTFSRSA